MYQGEGNLVSQYQEDVDISKVNYGSDIVLVHVSTGVE